MDINTIIDTSVQWLVDNYGLLLGIAAVLIIIVINELIKRRKKKKPPEKPKEEKAFSTEETLDAIGLKEDFVEANFMEENNTNTMKSQLRYVQEELRSKMQMYNKGKEQYKELMELDGRLRTYIKILQRQEKIFEQELGRLENEG